MSQITELYNKIISDAEIIKAKLSYYDSDMSDIQANRQINIPARIARLEELLEKIDDYRLRVKGFQELAKRNLNSQNVLTIEAPPGYRVNLNRLKRWALLIDPSSENDPYAQRVFAVAKCDELFLDQKEKEFRNRLARLKNNEISEADDDLRRLQGEAATLYSELAALAGSEDVVELSRLVNEIVNKASYSETNPAPAVYQSAEEKNDFILLGGLANKFDFGNRACDGLVELFGDRYNPERREVYLPLTLASDEEFIIGITCAPSRSRQLDRALQNLIMQQVESSETGTRSIYVLDAVRFNSTSIGSLRKIEDTFAVEQIPRNPEQLTGTLEQIVSTFGDIDEIIDTSDSIREYNAGVVPRKLPYSTVLLYGWPDAFSARDRELINRILGNYERYGVSVITVNYRLPDKQFGSDRSYLSDYALYNSMSVNMLPRKTTIRLRGEEDELPFVWSTFDTELPESYADSLKKNTIAEVAVGNDYLKRYDMETVPKYSREMSSLTVPFGVDGRDREKSISFDDHNFAAYLVGDAGSGKSTLIHTIVAGILRKYHPDNVELWMADFKQVEFKAYIEHMPPHVKYVLLDESQELVYDLIDKLNDEMFARQQLLASQGKENIKDLNIRELGRPVPVIFVMLDEFSIMSQAIENDQSYRLKLQNLLAKGRALGFKFLFASQKFTSGITGLTPTAKDQIQQRISMKAPKEEINEVLSLSPALRTEKVRNWIDAIPPYYALIKSRVDEDTLEVNRLKVMYFSDDYRKRNELIEAIRDNMKATEAFDYNDASTYLDKNPVIVDGNSYVAFDPAFIRQRISEAEKMEGDKCFVLGKPRLLSGSKIMTLSSESRENILILGRNIEQKCVLSILLSLAKAYRMQKGNVRVWAYEKSAYYKNNVSTWQKLSGQISVGMDQICSEIKALKETIRNGVPGDDLIILIGMERICSDFDYIGAGSGPDPGNAVYIPENEEKVDDEELFRHKLDLMVREKCLELRKKLEAESKSKEEIKKALYALRDELEKDAKSKFAAGNNIFAEETADENQKGEKTAEKTGAYNAAADFREIVKMGSRQGYHFVLVSSSTADFRSMGLNNDFFRHKLAFQMSAEDSYAVFNRKTANSLPEHTCVYDDSFETYSFRPYLHDEATWDGWSVADNVAVSPLKI